MATSSKNSSSGGSPQTPSQRRLQKELLTMIKEPPQGMTVDTEFMEGGSSDQGGSSTNGSLSFWQIRLSGAEGTIYQGENFILQFKFSQKYPFESPEVTFSGENIPVHPHVYSNGHICLSILTDDWSPALSVQAVCLSIISMLSSAKEKCRPPDDAFYVRTCSKNPKKTKWWYHDDTV